MGHVASMLVGEDELFDGIGVKVPEAVFATPSPAPRRVSVEVKRIVSLSHADGTRPSHGGFCWLSTIRSAVDKAHADLVCSYGLRDHHVVLCTHSGIRRRVERHARRILDAYVGSGASACAADASTCMSSPRLRACWRAIVSGEVGEGVVWTRVGGLDELRGADGRHAVPRRQGVLSAHPWGDFVNFLSGNGRIASRVDETQ